MRKLLLFIALFIPAVAMAGSASTDGAGSGSGSTDGLGSGTITISTQSAVVANGEIGTTTADALNTANSTTLYCSSAPATTAGQISYIHVYARSIGTGEDIVVGLYDENGTNLACGSGTGAGEGDQWTNVALDSPYTLEAGVDYFVCFASDDASWSRWRDNAFTGGYRIGISFTFSTTCSNENFDSPLFESNGTYQTTFGDNQAGDPS